MPMVSYCHVWLCYGIRRVAILGAYICRLQVSILLLWETLHACHLREASEEALAECLPTASISKLTGMYAKYM